MRQVLFVLLFAIFSVVTFVGRVHAQCEMNAPISMAASTLLEKLPNPWFAYIYDSPGYVCHARGEISFSAWKRIPSLAGGSATVNLTVELQSNSPSGWVTRASVTHQFVATKLAYLGASTNSFFTFDLAVNTLVPDKEWQIKVTHQDATVHDVGIDLDFYTATYYLYVPPTPTITPTFTPKIPFTPTPSRTPTRTPTVLTSTPTRTLTPTHTPSGLLVNCPPGDAAPGNWKEITSATGYGPRDRNATLSYKNLLWTFGGNSTVPPGGLPDVISSANGADWTPVLAHAPWTSRSAMGAAVFQSANAIQPEMWLIGGTSWDSNLNGGALWNDVWHSADGVKWTEAVTRAAFTPRRRVSTVVFNNKLWIVGGMDRNSALNEVWSSLDGVNWEKSHPNPSRPIFEPRAYAALTVFNNALWLAGGTDFNDKEFHDIWTSEDGINWTRVIPNIAVGNVVSASALQSFNGNLILFSADPNSSNSHIYSSADGKNWATVEASAPFGARYFENAANFMGRLWVINGSVDINEILGNTDVRDDVWSTDCGEPPTATFTSTATISPTPTSTVSATFTVTHSFTITLTPTVTSTPTNSFTSTPTTACSPNFACVYGAGQLIASAGSGNGQVGEAYGVAVDPSGTIYIADRVGNRIETWNASLGYQTTFGVGVLTQAAMMAYVNNILYVTDNHRVAAFNSAGTYLGDKAALGPNSAAWGLAVDNAGNVYVSDIAGLTVQKYNSAGALVWTTAAGIFASSTYSPQSVALDQNRGVLYVGSGAELIYAFDVNTGHELYQFGQIGTCVNDNTGFLSVAVDSHGNLIVGEANGHRVKRFAASTLGAGLTPGADALIFTESTSPYRYVANVGVDAQDRVYVVEQGANDTNDQVQRFNSCQTP